MPVPELSRCVAVEIGRFERVAVRINDSATIQQLLIELGKQCDQSVAVSHRRLVIEDDQLLEAEQKISELPHGALLRLVDQQENSEEMPPGVPKKHGGWFSSLFKKVSILNQLTTQSFQKTETDKKNNRKKPAPAPPPVPVESLEPTISRPSSLSIGSERHKHKAPPPPPPPNNGFEQSNVLNHPMMNDEPQPDTVAPEPLVQGYEEDAIPEEPSPRLELTKEPGKVNVNASLTTAVNRLNEMPLNAIDSGREGNGDKQEEEQPELVIDLNEVMPLPLSPVARLSSVDSQNSLRSSSSRHTEVQLEVVVPHPVTVCNVARPHADEETNTNGSESCSTLSPTSDIAGGGESSSFGGSVRGGSSSVMVERRSNIRLKDNQRLKSIPVSSFEETLPVESHSLRDLNMMDGLHSSISPSSVAIDNEHRLEAEYAKLRTMFDQWQLISASPQGINAPPARLLQTQLIAQHQLVRSLCEMAQTDAVTQTKTPASTPLNGSSPLNRRSIQLSNIISKEHGKPSQLGNNSQSNSGQRKLDTPVVKPVLTILTNQETLAVREKPLPTAVDFSPSLLQTYSHSVPARKQASSPRTKRSPRPGDAVYLQRHTSNEHLVKPSQIFGSRRVENDEERSPTLTRNWIPETKTQPDKMDDDKNNALRSFVKTQPEKMDDDKKNALRSIRQPVSPVPKKKEENHRTSPLPKTNGSSQESPKVNKSTYGMINQDKLAKLPLRGEPRRRSPSVDPPKVSQSAQPRTVPMKMEQPVEQHKPKQYNGLDTKKEPKKLPIETEILTVRPESSNMPRNFERTERNKELKKGEQFNGSVINKGFDHERRKTPLPSDNSHLQLYSKEPQNGPVLTTELHRSKQFIKTDSSSSSSRSPRTRSNRPLETSSSSDRLTGPPPRVISTSFASSPSSSPAITSSGVPVKAAIVTSSSSSSREMPQQPKIELGFTMPELRKVPPPLERHGIPLGSVIDGPREPREPLVLNNNNNNNNNNNKVEENNKPISMVNGNGKLMEEIKSARLKPTEQVTTTMAKKGGGDPRDDLMASIRGAGGIGGLRKVQKAIVAT